MVLVGIAQLALTPRPTGAARGLDAAAGLVRDAAADGAEFVVLPELWPTGPFELAETLHLAEPIDGPHVTALADLAAEAGVWLLGGSFLESASIESGATCTYNTTVLFDPAGTLAATYRKRHLFGFDAGEAALIDAGNDLVVVDTPLGPTGLATCYDLRFPEHFRALVDAGAEAVLMASGWPAARASHWQTLTRARAIENQVWLIGCNGAGSSGEVPLAGRSAVVDPWGEAVEAGTEEQVLTLAVDPAMVGQVRRDFPVLRDRRPTRPV